MKPFNYERLRRKRWSASAIRHAADIAKEKGVTVRLEPDGAIVVIPAGVAQGSEEVDEYDGLEKW
jgi:sugar phosphate isomerase/epimerase